MGQSVLWAFRRQPPVESDEQLTERARDGDGAAFGELYSRHRKAAESTACFLLRSRADADDVVAEAFAGVLAALRNGRGPRDNFRTYLLACVRNGCRARRPLGHPGRESSVDERQTPSVTFEDPERYVEADTVARAFATLNPRWQQTLWLSEVEQRPTSELGDHFQLSPNATAALTRRAREAFATAYLAQHLHAAPNDVCAQYADRLAAYVRDQLSDPQRLEVEQHLVTCEHCAAAAADLRDVNASLRTLVPVPGAVTGAAAATQLSLTGTSIGGMSTGLFGGGLLLKGAAAILVLAPVVVVAALPVVGVGGDDGRQPVVLESADDASGAPDAQPLALAPVDDDGPASVAPSPPRPTTPEPAAVPAVAPSTPRPAAVGVGPASPSPSIDPAQLQDILSLADKVIDDVVDPLVTTLTGSAAVLVDDVTATVRVVVATVDAGVANARLLLSDVLTADNADVVAPVIDEVADDVAPELGDALPAVALPSVPTLTSPPVNAGSPAAAVTVPVVVSVPPLTAPVVSVAPITVPVVSVPPVVVPPISVPAISVPALSVPAITVPGLLD